MLTVTEGKRELNLISTYTVKCKEEDHINMFSRQLLVTMCTHRLVKVQRSEDVIGTVQCTGLTGMTVIVQRHCRII